MRRLVSLILVGFMVAGAAYTFEIKRRAENASAEVRQLNRQITQEEETVELYKTDLSVLTQPQRLQELAELHSDELQLETLKVDQIITLEELPQRPIDLSPLQDDDQLGGYANSSGTNIQ